MLLLTAYFPFNVRNNKLCIFEREMSSEKKPNYRILNYQRLLLRRMGTSVQRLARRKETKGCGNVENEVKLTTDFAD
jgi:hypothetical protein